VALTERFRARNDAVGVLVHLNYEETAATVNSIVAVSVLSLCRTDWDLSLTQDGAENTLRPGCLSGILGRLCAARCASRSV
jgi:hypothetical protein